MARFCPNCGDPVEPDEIFCDKCGTRVRFDEGDSNQQQSQDQYINYNNQNQVNTNQVNQNYQNQTNQGNYQSQQFQNFNQGNMQQDMKNSRTVKKNSKRAKIGKISGIIVAVIAVLRLILLLVPHNTPENPGTNVVDTTKPVSTTKPAAATSQVTWAADLNSYATYAAADKKINVDYSMKLKNLGTGNAANVKAYLDPGANDPNAAATGVQPKTIINIEGDIPAINAGETKDVAAKYYYSNIEADAATQDKLQDLASKYVKLPLLIEWEENGKKYNQKLIATNTDNSTSNNSNKGSTDKTGSNTSNSKFSNFFGVFQLAVPGVSYTTENEATNTTTTTTSTGVQAGEIQIKADGTYIWNSSWDGKIINGTWQETGDSGYPLVIKQGEEGKDWSLGKSDQEGSDIILWNGSIWKMGKRTK